MNRAIAHGVVCICCFVHLVHGDEFADPLPSPSSGAVTTELVPPVGQAMVTHANGAVTLQIPALWSVLELPLGRQIRLVMSPDPLVDGANLRRGIWLSLYYHERIERLSNPQLAERAGAVLRSRYREIQAEENPTFGQLDVHRFVRLNFSLPRRRADPQHGRARKIQTDIDGPAEAADETTFLPTQVGFYFLVQMHWGLCEICGISPAPDKGELNELLKIVSEVRIRRPEAPHWEPTAATKDASQIFGSWKASKSRLRIQPNAEMIILADDAFAFTAREEHQQRSGKEITGGYVAEGDVLLVTWLDGSKLNYRWRLLDNKLLLTDHKGRTTRLLRILE